MQRKTVKTGTKGNEEDKSYVKAQDNPGGG